MKKTILNIEPQMPPRQMMDVALAKERALFLLPIKIKLALVGLLVLIPRIAGSARFKGPLSDFILGWPSVIIWTLAATLCFYGLYNLLRKNSPAFLKTPVSTPTREALLGALPEKARKDLFDAAPHPLLVADIIKARAALEDFQQTSN